MRLSPLQMTDAKSWKGLTTENHLGAIWKQEPQRASNIITMIQQKNFGDDLEGFLSRFPTKMFENDTEYFWELMSQGIDNIPLVEARIDGVAVTAGSQVGKNLTFFELAFAKDWFSETEKIVGEKNELYPIVVKEQREDGDLTVYTCQLHTGNLDLFIPFAELTAGKLFSREFAPVERTLSEKGRQVKYKSHITLRNAFSQIRIQKETPGNLKDRKLGTYLPDGKGGKFIVWQQYESYIFDMEFRQDINRLCMFGTSNRTESGDYLNKGPSGNMIVEGSGLREQSEASNTSFYNTFSIQDLTDKLMDISEGKLGMDERTFLMRTGERGAVQFHEALEDFSQLYVPNRDEKRIYNASASYANMGKGYGGQFVEYYGPNNMKVMLSVGSEYDSRNRNKIYHPDGGVAESYRYDIYDIGTTDGEPNIQKVGVTGKDYVIHKYIPGMRNPFDPDGGMGAMSSPVDGWEEHKYWCGGVILRDPTKTASFISNLQQP